MLRAINCIIFLYLLAPIIVVIATEVLLLGLPIQLQIIIKGIVIVLAAALYAR